MQGYDAFVGFYVQTIDGINIREAHQLIKEVRSCKALLINILLRNILKKLAAAELVTPRSQFIMKIIKGLRYEEIKKARNATHARRRQPDLQSSSGIIKVSEEKIYQDVLGANYDVNAHNKENQVNIVLRVEIGRMFQPQKSRV